MYEAVTRNCDAWLGSHGLDPMRESGMSVWLYVIVSEVDNDPMVLPRPARCSTPLRRVRPPTSTPT